MQNVTVLPMLTPFYYSELIEQLACNNWLRVKNQRMQPHYKKKFKKRK